MKLNKNITVDETLLINYLAGEASPDEAAAIENWARQPGNKKQLNSLIKTWNIVGKKDQFNYINKETAWNYLQINIQNKSALKSFYIKTRIIAAASIFLILVTVILLLYNLHKNDKRDLEEIQLVAVKGTIYKLLPDSSSIILAGNSLIKYNSAFNTNNREVWLYGEAYFIVTPNKKLPFKIHDSDLTAEVIGTKFNISKVGNEIKVQVHSGIVSLYNSNDKILVSKGKTGIYNIASKKLFLDNSINNNSMSYATKNFNFNNTSLAEVGALLEKAFNVKVEFKNARLRDCKITARFQNESLDYILQIISITLDISCIKKNNVVLIDGKACD